jgi:hypothetical protein
MGRRVGSAASESARALWAGMGHAGSDGGGPDACAGTRHMVVVVVAAVVLLRCCCAAVLLCCCAAVCARVHSPPVSLTSERYEARRKSGAGRGRGNSQPMEPSTAP